MSAFRIQRYLLREIFVPMLLGLFIFTFVMLMGRSQKLMEMVIDKGVPFSDMAHLFCDLMPAFLVLTIPVALLLGVLLGFGRLSAESELVALKACGVSLPVMMRPVIGLALCACLATASLTLFIEPAANAAFRQQAFRIAGSHAASGIQAQVFNDDFTGLVLYTSEIDAKSGEMHGVFIADERSGSIPTTTFARNGSIQVDPQEQTLLLRLENGSIHRREAGGEHLYQIIGFDSYALRIDLEQGGASGKGVIRKENELSLGELYAASRTATGKESRALNAGLHKRFVLATTPLLFALVGVPLGIRSHRSGRGVGFAVALGIFLAFYILFSLAKTLTVQGGFPAIIMWLPVLVFLGAGIVLLRNAAREREFSFNFSDLLNLIWRRDS